VWNRVIRANGLPDYLCLTCIVHAFASRGESFTADLVGETIKFVPIAVEVNGKAATDASDVQEENNRLRWRLHELGVAGEAAGPAEAEISESILRAETRDSMVLAWEAGKGACLDALRRAVARERQGDVMPLTGQECVQILETVRLEPAPVAAAPARTEEA
jgi:hypothetical protein